MPPKTARPQPELLEALRRNVRLLGAFIHQAFDIGDDDYLGEVAGKLRLLTSHASGNKPLLVWLMRETRIEIPIQLDGPPDVLRREGVQGPISVKDYMALDAVWIQVPSGGLGKLTNLELVRFWAEQAGAAHEDWSMDDRLSALLSSGIEIGGVQGAAAALRAVAATILHVATVFLAAYDAPSA